MRQLPVTDARARDIAYREGEHVSIELSTELYSGFQRATLSVSTLASTTIIMMTLA